MTKVLLVPSVVAETFGRVVVEAQTSGIPVIVRNVGALKWVTGAGGIVLAADAPALKWAQTIDRILSDSAEYQSLSAEASSNVQRSDFLRSSVVDRFEEVLRSAMQAPPN